MSVVESVAKTALVLCALLGVAAIAWMVLAPREPALHEKFRGRMELELARAPSPWSLAHGLLAFGTEAELHGEKLGDVVVGRWLRTDAEGDPYFELSGSQGQLGEQHPHLVLKTFAEMGYAPELCQELLQAARRNFVAPATAEEWDHSAWLLDAEARLGGGDPQLASGVLERVEEGDVLVEAALAAAGEDGTGFQRPSAQGGAKESGIWAYTCGGQHLLQALLVAAQSELHDEAERARLAQRVKIFLKRLEGEYQFRRREEARAIASGVSPVRAQRQSSQRLLKLLGHALETLARAQRAGLGDGETLAAAIHVTRSRLEELMRVYLEVLDPDGTLLAKLYQGDPQAWERWFGDGCHALRGYQLTHP